MGELVCHILTFVVIITVLKGLISNEEYKQYFHFFSGMVMIVILCKPLFSFSFGDADWYQLLEDMVIEEEVEEKLDEIKLADGKMEEMLRKSCKRAIEEQVNVLAEREGFVVDGVNVKLSENNDALEVLGIKIMVSDSEPFDDEKQNDGVNEGMDGKSKTLKDIEDIEIEKVEPVEGSDAVPVSEAIGSLGKQQMTGKRASRLKNTLKDYYMLQEGAVEIWKY